RPGHDRVRRRDDGGRGVVPEPDQALHPGAGVPDPSGEDGGAVRPARERRRDHRGGGVWEAVGEEGVAGGREPEPSFPSSAWERRPAQLRWATCPGRAPYPAPRLLCPPSGAWHPCVPKRSLGTRTKDGGAL